MIHNRLIALWISAFVLFALPSPALEIELSDGDTETVRIVRREGGSVTLGFESPGMGMFSKKYKESDIVPDEKDWLNQARNALAAGRPNKAYSDCEDILVWNPDNDKAKSLQEKAVNTLASGKITTDLGVSRVTKINPRNEAAPLVDPAQVRTARLKLSEAYTLKTGDKPFNYQYQPMRDCFERILTQAAGLKLVTSTAEADIVFDCSIHGTISRAVYDNGRILWGLQGGGKLEAFQPDGLSQRPLGEWGFGGSKQPSLISHFAVKPGEEPDPEKEDDPRRAPFGGLLMHDMHGAGSAFLDAVAAAFGPEPLLRIAANPADYSELNKRNENMALYKLAHIVPLDSRKSVAQLGYRLLKSTDPKINETILNIWKIRKSEGAPAHIGRYLAESPLADAKTIRMLEEIPSPETAGILLRVARGDIAPTPGAANALQTDRWPRTAITALRNLDAPEAEAALSQMTSSPDADLAGYAQKALETWRRNNAKRQERQARKEAADEKKKKR